MASDTIIAYGLLNGNSNTPEWDSLGELYYPFQVVLQFSNTIEYRDNLIEVSCLGLRVEESQKGLAIYIKKNSSKRLALIY